MGTLNAAFRDGSKHEIEQRNGRRRRRRRRTIRDLVWQVREEKVANHGNGKKNNS